MADSIQNCYKILGIPQNASLSQIKAAFRKKAKKFHPDVMAAQSKQNERAFHEILFAYRALSEMFAKKILDRSFGFSPGEKPPPFDYREWLLAQEGSVPQAKLVVLDLLTGFEGDAVARYMEAVKKFPQFSISICLEREEFMDYGYILAEELAARQEFYDSYMILSQIIRCELKRPYFRLFFGEVLAFAQSILNKKIEKNTSEELSLDAWEDALTLCFLPAEKRLLAKKIAAVYKKMGDNGTAQFYLNMDF